MNILRILALLGRGDQASSEGMYEVLVDVMKRADTGINVGFAIGKYRLFVCLFVYCVLSVFVLVQMNAIQFVVSECSYFIFLFYF